MLTESLDKAEARAERVIDAAGSMGRSSPLEHARTITERVVPDIRSERDGVLTFISSAEVAVRDSLRLNDLEGARPVFDRLVNDLLRLSLRMNLIGAQISVARAAVGQDIADIQSDLAQLNVVLAQRTATVADANERIKENALRSALTWLVGPIGKGIDEIVSLAQTGSPTEWVLVDAIRDLERARADVDRLAGASASLSQLSDDAASLTQAVQGLLNALALTLGHMTNARDDLREASQLALFGETALLDLESLRAEAA